MEPIITVTHRVDRLESVMISLAEQLDRTAEQLDRTAEQLDRTAEQLDRTTEQVDRTAEQVDRTSEKVEQLSAEMADFKTEVRSLNKKTNVQIGHLANRLGTMVEDLVIPSIGRILKQVVNCEGNPSTITVRTTRETSDGRIQEYDGVVSCGDYLLICDAKSRLDVRDIERFKRILSGAREFMPEYAHLNIIGAMGTLYVDKSVVVRGEREGLIMLGTGDELMDILNKDGFVPTTF